jgi:phosphoserine phosphatase
MSQSAPPAKLSSRNPSEAGDLHRESGGGGGASAFAILDVDGTLCPGALGIELLRALMKAGACELEGGRRVLEILAEYRVGVLDFSTMAKRAYGTYAAALAGREVEVVEAIAREVWATQRERMFAFVPELLTCLRTHELEPMLISGSPLEMVRLVAAELDIAEAHGAVFGREGGRYTGRVDLGSGIPGRKPAIFAAATRERAPRLERCFAIGDSLTDLPLFERVGLPLVFEADPDLAAIAAARGWTMATRENVLARVRGLLGPGPAPGSDSLIDNPRNCSC